VGVIYSSQSFLRLVRGEVISVEVFKDSFRRFEVADAAQVLELVQKCRWTSVTTNGVLQLTERGQIIVAVEDPALCLREQLADIISVESPPWARRIALGRFEAQRSMPENAAQCFKECGLLGECNYEVVGWWDSVNQAIRSRKANFNIKVGRAAECFTIARERVRTRKEPVWQAVESNVAGYDVLSQIAEDRVDPLQIEVKGSLMRTKEAMFFITRNEWETAKNSANYEFQLWLVHEQLRLFVVGVELLEQHLPHNRRGGRWETTQLWFRDFVEQEVKLDNACLVACDGVRAAFFPTT